MDTPQLPAGPLRKALERFDAAFRDLGDDAALAGEMAEHERYLATVAAFDLDWLDSNTDRTVTIPLLAGIYEAGSGARLPISGAPDFGAERLLLGQVEIR